VLFTETEEHLGPDGAILGTRSTDNGESWEPPSVVYDTPIDDRESGITLLSDGTIVAHLWSTFHTRAGYDALARLSYEPSTLGAGLLSLTLRVRASVDTQGAWTILSRDHGRTWSHPSGDAMPCTAAFNCATEGSRRFIPPGLPSHRVYSAVMPEMNFTRIATIEPSPADSITFAEPHMLQMSTGGLS